MKTYSNYLTDIPRYINNSDSDNVTWGIQVVNESLRYLTTRYYFNEKTYTVPGGTVAQQQFYNWPPQVKKIINVTVTIGSVLWQPIECPTRQFWDSLNVIQFYQDFPAYFFIYNNQVGIYPTPASNGNKITINYKTRITDLSQADYTTGTVSATNNSTTITGSGTTFSKSMAGRWLRIASSSTDSANGDFQWYQIDSVTNATTLVLTNVYSGSNVTGGTYVIGEAPILPEDYQDLPLFRMAIEYYTTRFPDPVRAAGYQKLYDDGLAALDDEYGSKTSSVVLNDTSLEMVNPNLFAHDLSSH